jgi:peptidoglycan/LPS O-acetylase OafA/YrhL
MLVVCFHLVGRTSSGWLSSRGYLGVAIFFVLSGFVITSSIGGQRISAGFLGRFAARRSIRLDIPYWSSILVAVVLALGALRFGIPRPRITGTQILAHMFYLQEILGFPEISQAYWTLCLEIQFYLTLIVGLWAAQSARIRVEATAFQSAFIGGILLSVLCNTGYIGSPRGFMPPYWWAFALGAETYWLSIRRIPLRYFLVSLIAVMLVPWMIHSDWRLVGACTAALLIVAARLGTMHIWLSGRIAQFLGRISYSLYLFHPLVGWMAQSVALRYVSQYPALVVGVLASIASGWLSYRLIERPATKLSRSISLASSRAAPATQAHPLALSAASASPPSTTSHVGGGADSGLSK